MHLTLILPFPDVLEPVVATHRFPLPLGSNLGWLVYQNWGGGHASGKLLHTLGWVVGASLGVVAGGGDTQKEKMVAASGPNHIQMPAQAPPCPRTHHPQPAPCPAPPSSPRELGVYQSWGTSLNCVYKNS